MTEYHSYAEALEEAEEKSHRTGPGPSKLQPALIIPTFWTVESSKVINDPSSKITFEHPTDIEDPHPGLALVLNSLVNKPRVGKIIIVVGVTDRLLLPRADARVREIASAYPQLDIFVMGESEIGSLFRRLEQLDLSGLIPSLDLDSYGAMRNLGLMAAAVMGKDSVIFVDDDEVVENDAFIETGLFGLGLQIHNGGRLLAKSGYYTNQDGSWQHPTDDEKWTDVMWRQEAAFNKALSSVMQPPRLQPARIAFGGCMALHKDVYTTIAFDPWVTRGEDLDYLINMRLHGGEMYIDDQWSVMHLSSGPKSPALRYRQNVYRFIYEHRKLEFAKSQVDLARVTPESLAPYPGDFVDGSVILRARITSLLRAISSDERKLYWHIGTKSIKDAGEYARKHCGNYFALQRAWTYMMERLFNDVPLGTQFKGERTIDRTAFTGEFRAL